MKAQSYVDKKTGRPTYAVINWYMTEKFDGQRAQWDPGTQKLVSRYNNCITAPQWFLDQFRDITIPLDGELFLGYGNWGLTGIFRAKSSAAQLENEDIWKKVKYMVFDIPDLNAGTYEERMKILDAQAQNWSSPFVIAKRQKVTSKEDIDLKYKDILRRGGEGLIFNNPVSFYRDGRTDCILKYKPIMDEECIVVGYKPGKGANLGKLGSFIVHPIEDGLPIKQKEFSISGMTNVVRSNYMKTHPLGTIIRYSCLDYTSTGKPRHPVYLGKCLKPVMNIDIKQLAELAQADNKPPPPVVPVAKIKIRFKLK